MSSLPPLDLRSDTVTRPTHAMREAMASAPVGDDVYGEDPTVQELERVVAELAGKEAALFVPSGTMSNQLALLCHTRPGDEVVVGEGSHCAYYESGAGAAIAGVQFATAGRGGLFNTEELEAALKPIDDHCPRSRLVVVENTHNRAGGRIFPQDQVLAIAALARSKGLALHLDGARLWNASVATGLSVAELCAPFDTVSVCFSKSLGAPAGSALLGPRELLREARRLRKRLGGGMRQVGILAAGALYALRHHRERLEEDHAAAQRLREAICALPGVHLGQVETNILNVDLEGTEASRVVTRGRELGLWLGASGPRRIRVVTHLDLPAERVEEAAALLRRALVEAPPRA